MSCNGKFKLAGFINQHRKRSFNDYISYRDREDALYRLTFRNTELDLKEMSIATATVMASAMKTILALLRFALQLF